MLKVVPMRSWESIRPSPPGWTWGLMPLKRPMPQVSMDWHTSSPGQGGIVAGNDLAHPFVAGNAGQDEIPVALADHLDIGAAEGRRPHCDQDATGRQCRPVRPDDVQHIDIS